MMIALGRRRLILALVTTPPQPKRATFPMAENATDAELARLNQYSAIADDRRRWEVAAILYGGYRPR
jgi:hypothetical protein